MKGAPIMTYALEIQLRLNVMSNKRWSKLS